MNKKAFLLAIFTVFIWGSAFASISASLQGGFSAGHLILFRFIIASIIFGLLALVPSLKFNLPKKEDILPILVLSWIGISIYHVCVTFGQLTITAGTAGMLIGSAPIFTTIIAVVVLKERIGTFGWIGLGFGFIGITMIGLGTGESSFDISPGVFLVILAALATSIFFVFQKSLLTKYTPIELTAYFTWAGTLPFLFFAPGLIQGIQHASLEANLSAIYIGIFPTAIAYLMWAYALSQSKASSVSSLLYAEPVIAIFIAWVWLHELPSTLSISGGIIAISGVLIVQLFGRRKKRKSIN
ncbi:DMT family transporter [Psychrobacillus sp. FJAT-51614]|uniref:DMT family transporter n=1 Tax=Psychrobacillus mangrovi TaxID=3117745 RepID=A0ABU8F9C6_9BACI